MNRLIRLTLYWVLLMAGPAVATGKAGNTALPYEDQADLAGLFDAPCERYGVPKDLALAIAGHESGMRPWAMNIQGKPVLNTSKEEALSVSQIALASGLSFDVGVMQINSQWLRRFKLPLDVVFDPRGNIQVGVWILSQAIKQHGLTWRAVASYHSPHPERGKAYATAVLARLAGHASSPSSTFMKSSSASAAPASSPILVRRFREVASNERIVR